MNSFFNGITIFQAFSFFFIYAALLSLAIQLIILPFLGPTFHLGDGLLDGGDWQVIHFRASTEAEKIITNGWNAWVFRPEGWGIVGLISAHYAFFEVNKPFLLIPIFSGLHALGTICILKLMETLGIKRSTAFYSSIPYLIFPSSLLWVTQLLKDGFTLNGALLILLGLVSLFNYSKQEAIGIKIKNQILSAVLIFIGLIIIWAVRPYMLNIYFLFIFLILSLFYFSIFISLINKKTSIFIALILMLIQISFIAFNYSSFKWSIPYSYPSSSKLTMLSEVVEDNKSIGEHSYSGMSFDHYEAQVKQVSRENVINLEKIIEFKKSILNEMLANKQFASKDQPVDQLIVQNLVAEIDDLTSKTLIEQANVEFLISNIDNNKLDKYVLKDWIDSKYLPFPINNNLKRIYVNREYFFKWNHHELTAVDSNIYLNDPLAMLGYIPRALQILYLAPFPTLWLKNFSIEASSIMSSIMYIVVGFEMLFIYIFLIGALFSFYIWRKKIEIWIMLLFSLYIGLLYTYAFPNIGALVRYRYASIMILAALGISAFIYLYSRKKTILSSKL